MPSQFFGLTIASSGLSAFQASLNTTANNISNVKTVGYTRQCANLASSAALRVYAKYGSAGTGVEVTSITQIRNEYYDTKFWQNQSALGLFETKLGYLRQIENYYMDSDVGKGFTSILNDMFNSLDSLKDNAESVSYRQQFISRAQNFASYFNATAVGLGRLQESVNEEIKSTVANINAIGKKISLLNEQINIIELEGGYANELRDQRAVLVDELSAIAEVEVSEVPVSNSKFPDMLTGANYYTVKINGQKFVDTYEYNPLVCKARENKINQSDMDGMYEIYWESTGNRFDAGSKFSSGSLKAMFDIRDGNNEENFTGTVNKIENGKTLKMTNPSITNLNALSMPKEGVLTIDGKDYVYTDFSFEADAEGNVSNFVFELKEALTMDQQARIEGRKASVGEAIDAKGIPYYMSQMNEFLRSFASAFNEIMEEGQDLNGNDIDFSFFKSDNLVLGGQIDFLNLKKDVPDAGTKRYTASDNTYFLMTCRNFAVDKGCIKDPTKIATTANVKKDGEHVENGEAAYELVERMLLLKSDTVLFRGAGADDFLECMYSDISVDTNETGIFYENYFNIANTIDNQRMSISGVDEDEEALNLIKFQNAYNLSSKMISVFAEIYDRLILETGV